MFDTFRSSSKLINTFNAHEDIVWSIDYSTFNDCQFLCSGSYDAIVSVWDIDNNKQIQSFDEDVGDLSCVKFSSYHNHNNHQNVVCFSSFDGSIHFWDFKHNKQLKIFDEHTSGVSGIEFSSFNGDNTIRLWDVETLKSLYIFNGHEDEVRCVDMSPLQSNNNNESNNIGVIGGNGYTICSGSCDQTIRIWDIETTKQFNIFKGHAEVMSIKYGSNELLNTILSGSDDDNVRLWDIRSGKQIQVFNGHKDYVRAVEYSPF
ncbi:hypothetical protein RFI_03785, partial [Reticulomyxa filosa]